MSQAVDQLAQAGDEGGDHARLAAFGPADEGGPVSGSQFQYGDGQSDTTQQSTGVSKSDNNQSMRQRELAPENSTGLIQDQIGPFRCCTSQGTNPKDKFTVRQSKRQFASTLPQVGGEEANLFALAVCECSPGQTLSEDGTINTSGNGSISQFADQNGAQASNNCTVTNGVCLATLDGNDGVFTSSSCSGACEFAVGLSLNRPAHGQRARAQRPRVN
jgi:hypothetical protein